MGLLKHFALPMLALVHGYQGWYLLSNGKSSLPELYGWPDTTPLSLREMHLMGIVLSISVTLMINCIIGIFIENAHYRGMATLLEVVFFSFQAYDAYVTGYPVTVKLILALFTATALMIHSMEPGVFTKDKTAKTKTK